MTLPFPKPGIKISQQEGIGQFTGKKKRTTTGQEVSQSASF
jgi:hypothetical protein